MNVDLLCAYLFDDGGIEIAIEDTHNFDKVSNENLGELSVNLFRDQLIREGCNTVIGVNQGGEETT